MNVMLFIFFCFSMLHMNAQDSTSTTAYSITGFVKDLQMITFLDEMKESTSSNMFHNRFSTKYHIHEELTIRGDIRNRFFWGDPNILASMKQQLQSKPGLLGMSEIVLDDSGVMLHSIIDRISLSYAPEHWNITLGRQRINWGVHTIWNPNDIFNTYNILDFDYEERPGCDALRIQRFSDDYTFEFAIKPDTTFDKSIGALLIKSQYGGFDMQLLTGWYKEDFIIGGGWAGNIGDAGFKGEFSYFIPFYNQQENKNIATVSLQLDQTFDNDWYCSIGALYNQNANEQSFSRISTNNLSPKNMFPFEISYFFGVQKQMTPIHTMGCSLIYSPYNNALIAIPSIAYNIAENIDIDFIGQLFFFRNEVKEYTNLSTSLFFRSRWSF